MTRPTLKDPPDYVAIPPTLIYDSHDLTTETRDRLYQILGWMWVTKKSGKPLGTQVSELAERWGVHERTVYRTLEALASGQYLHVQYSGRGWASITKGPKLTHHRPREVANNMQSESATRDTPAPQQAARGGNTQATRSGDTQAARGGNHNRPREVADTQHNLRDTPCHETAESRDTGCHEPYTISSTVVDVVDIESISRDLQHQQQHTMHACQNAGLWPDVAVELATDPWMTPGRVQGWHEALTRMKARGQTIAGRPIGSVQALLVANLRAHREPPAQEHSDDGGSHRQRRLRFAESNRVCPHCYTRPCTCLTPDHPQEGRS